MSLRYSNKLIQNLQNPDIKPVLVLELDGVPFFIGSEALYKKLRYGDGYLYGEAGLFYGGYVLIDEDQQKSLISIGDGTTTQITQQLNIDKAQGNSITTMQITIVDLGGIATRLVSGEWGEIIYKDVKVWIGFDSQQSDFNRDYILILRGIVENVQAGQAKVILSLNSPDQKRRQTLAVKGDTELAASLTNVATVVQLDTSANFFVTPTHPSYSPRDYALRSYVRIEDEIIEYDSVSGNNLSGCTRGQLFTSAVAHNIDTQSSSYFVLEGNALDLALKIMLSNEARSDYLEDLAASTVGVIGSDVFLNSFYFTGLDIVRDYNIQVGDWVRTSGFTNGANNFATYKQITAVEVISSGSYITVNGTLVNENPTSGLVSFLSQYNTFGKFGLGMKPEEVDIQKHVELKNNFLLNASVRIYVKEEIDEAKSFIELELYKPFAAYGLPQDRSGLSRLSVGLHIPPLPLQQMVEINETNVTNPSQLTSKRSLNKYHYNIVGFEYNDLPLEDEDKFFKKIFVTVGTPLIASGNKTLKISSKGLRDDLNAGSNALSASTRLLNRYKGAAEYYDNIQVTFGVGSRINIGDILIFNGTNLNTLNRLDSTRGRPPFLAECINKTTDIKTGVIKLTIIDTNFNINARFGLISPSSKVTTVVSQTKFQVEHWNGPTFSSYGTNEGAKYNEVIGSKIKIYNSTFTQIFETTLLEVQGNFLVTQTAPPFTVVAGTHFIKLATFSSSSDRVKLIYAFLSDDVNNFPDGSTYYQIFG